ncbi:hypothetical protein CapIbe_003234 [Capra ibex]
MTGYGISFPAVSRVSLFLLPFLRSTAYSDVVVTVVAEVQWIPNIVLVSGGRQSDPGPAYLRCSSAVIPPPLPFRLRYPKGGFCHCARRRLLAHTPEAKPRASGLAPCSHLSVPRTPLPRGRWNSAKGQLAALAGNRTRVLCLEGSYAHHYTTNAPQPGRPPHAGPSILSPPPPHPCPDAPSAGGSAPPPAPPAATRRPQRASATRSPGSTGPAALRPSGPSLPAAARQRLRPHPRRATRGTQLPAPSWPKPYSTGRWARPLPTTTRGHGTHLPARVAAP